MIRINLLPHREEKRRERRQQFYVIAGAMLVLGLAIGALVHFIIGGYIDRQERRNAYFKAEITKLDAEIAEIKRIREQIDALLARKQVIESLQETRAQSVLLLNELAVRVPDGIYLRSIKQSGLNVSLLGYAQSNARVSHLMRSLEESPHLTQPRLIEVKSATLNNRRVSDFSLNVAIERPQPDEQAGGKQ